MAAGCAARDGGGEQTSRPSRTCAALRWAHRAVSCIYAVSRATALPHAFRSILCVPRHRLRAGRAGTNCHVPSGRLRMVGRLFLLAGKDVFTSSGDSLFSERLTMPYSPSDRYQHGAMGTLVRAWFAPAATTAGGRNFVAAGRPLGLRLAGRCTPAAAGVPCSAATIFAACLKLIACVACCGTACLAALASCRAVAAPVRGLRAASCCVCSSVHLPSALCVAAWFPPCSREHYCVGCVSLDAALPAALRALYLFCCRVSDVASPVPSRVLVNSCWTLCGRMLRLRGGACLCCVDRAA